MFRIAWVETTLGNNTKRCGRFSFKSKEDAEKKFKKLFNPFLNF